MPIGPHSSRQSEARANGQLRGYCWKVCLTQCQRPPLALGHWGANLLAGVEVQLLEDICDVVVYRTLGDHKL
jgi:hypothetical protein